MNVIIEGKLKNLFSKEYKDKKTGEVTKNFILQVEQTEKKDNDEVEFKYLNIPIDTNIVPNYKDKKNGDIIKIPCNVYGDNFAEIKISKYKN